MSKRFVKLDEKMFKNAEVNDHGFLVANKVYATRTGVFKYIDKDGNIRRELRHPDDVFESDSMESLKNVVITEEHPKDAGKQVLINSENAKKFSRGMVGNSVVIADSRFLEVPAIVTDKKLIDSIVKKGVTEVSCGYTCDLVQEQGTYKGQKYDLRQKNIKYNHLAVTVSGRGGGEVSIRLDSLDDTDAVETQELEKMEKIVIDGKEYEVSEDLKSAIMLLKEKLQSVDTDKADSEKKVKELEDKSVEMKEENEKLEARADSLKEDLEKAQDELKQVREDSDNVERIDSLVQERVELYELHGKYVKNDSNLSELSTSDIKTEIVKACYPKSDLEGKSETYLDARLDSIKEAAPTAFEKIENSIKTKKEDKTVEVDPEQARLDSIKSDYEAGRKSLI